MLETKHSVGSKGRRVDSSCGAILKGNRLELPFSFMTFIIREKNTLTELNEDTFEMEGYLFRISGENCFHKYYDNYAAFEVCLDGLREANQDLLSLLLHPDLSGFTPLGKASWAGKKRMVQLIMENLAYTIKADSVNTQLIKQHFKQLINFHSFEEFLQNCFFQTAQMAQVESLTANMREDDNLYIGAHNTCFLDKGFHRQFTNDDKPQRFVVVKAMDANWMLTSQDGEDFLVALKDSTNPFIFQNHAVRTLVLYMWKHYRKQIVKQLFLPFAIYMLLFVFSRTFTFENKLTVDG